MKFYKRRDSATSVLRKLGINSRDYNLFIKSVGGGFELDDKLAESHVNNLKNVPKKKPSKIPFTEFCKEKILEGLSNKEIFEEMKKHYGPEITEEKHKNYPAWNRAKLRRIGVLDFTKRTKDTGVYVIYE